MDVFNRTPTPLKTFHTQSRIRQGNGVYRDLLWLNRKTMVKRVGPEIRKFTQVKQSNYVQQKTNSLDLILS